MKCINHLPLFLVLQSCSILTACERIEIPVPATSNRLDPVVSPIKVSTPLVPNTPPVIAPLAPVNNNGNNVNPINTTTNSRHNLFVSTNGSDSNDGSEQKPFKTIQKAASVVEPSTTVHVLEGQYDGGIVVKNSGTKEEPIYFQGMIDYKSKIINGKNNMMFDIRGNYVHIEGFDFDGIKDTSTTNAIYLGGSFNVARDNKVHDIGIQAACTSGGGSGIKTDNYYGGMYNDVLNNTVYNIGPLGCKFVQGIYLSTPGLVENNLVYNASGAGISSWHNATDLTITHNTVFNNDFGITLGSGDYYNGNNKPNDNSIVANNIVYDNKTRGIDEEGKVGGNNKILNNLTYLNGTNIVTIHAKNENNIVADPQFIDYKPNGTGDYRLKDNSPAVGKGLAQLMPQFDLVGTVRTKPDMGAYALGARKPGDPINTTPITNAPIPKPPINLTPTIPNGNNGNGSSGGENNGNSNNGGGTGVHVPLPPGMPFPNPANPVSLNGNNSSNTNGSYEVPNTSNTVYVSPNGLDTNNGTQNSPLKTISQASKIAKPGTTVVVLPGEYRENVKTNTSGSSISAKINYVSLEKWKAKIIGSGTESAWNNKGSFVNIMGFEVTGSGRLGILNEGSNTTISYNHVHDLAASGGCNGSGGAGINNGNYSASNGDIIGNVVHDIGYQYAGSCNTIQGIYSSNFGGKIMNNVVYRAAAFGIHLWHAATDVTITNNTVFNNGAGTKGGGIVIGTGDSPGGVILDNTSVINNIVYNNANYSIIEYCSSGDKCIGNNNTVDNNIVYGNGQDIIMKVGKDINTLKVDPQFMSSSDYHLKSTSPAINNGKSVANTELDIDDKARIINNKIDIGAQEAG